MDPLEALKSRRQAALSRRSDPLDELKRRKTLVEDTALSPLMDEQPLAVSRPSLPAGPRRSQMLPAVTTTAAAPKKFEQTLARAIAKETKKSAPYGSEEDLTPEQQQQLARAQYGRAVSEDIGKAFVGQPARTVYRTATGIATLRKDPRAQKLAETLSRVEQETAPETLLGAAPRLVAEAGAFFPSGLALGAIRSGLESAAGGEFSTANLLRGLAGKEEIKDPRLRAVADAGIDLAIPGMIAAVKAAKTLKEALKVGDELGQAFALGAKEGASEGAESVVGSFARKDGYRKRTTPEANPARLLTGSSSQTVPIGTEPAPVTGALQGPAIPTRGVVEPITNPSRLLPPVTGRTIPIGAEVAPVTGATQGPAIPMPSGVVRPEGPSSTIMRLLAPKSEALRQRLFWMPAVREAAKEVEAAAPVSAVRRRTREEVLARRPEFQQPLPEGATPEEIAAYVEGKAKFVGRSRTPIEVAMEQADEWLADRALRTEVFGTPAQRREALERAARLRRSEKTRGATIALLPDDVLEQAAREVAGEITPPRGEEVPDFLRNVPTDEVIREIDAINQTAEVIPPTTGKRVPVRKMSDDALSAELTAREAQVAEAEATIQMWEDRTGGVLEQFTSKPRSSLLTPEMRARQTRATQARNPVTGELLETAAERRARERGISDENLARLEEAGFADRDDFLAQKKEIDKLRFSIKRMEKSRDAARAEYARRTGATEQAGKPLSKAEQYKAVSEELDTYASQVAAMRRMGAFDEKTLAQYDARLAEMAAEKQRLASELPVVEPTPANVEPLPASPFAQVTPKWRKVKGTGGAGATPDYTIEGVPELEGYRLTRTEGAGGSWNLLVPYKGIGLVPLAAWNKEDAIASAIARVRRYQADGGIANPNTGKVTPFEELTRVDPDTGKPITGYRAGFVSPTVASAVGGAGAGFTAGLATDQPDDGLTPLQRALLYAAGGAAGGAGVVAGVQRGLRGAQRVVPSIPELAPVAETINVGRRTPAPATPGILGTFQKLYNDVVSETFVLEKTAERYGGGAARRAEIQGAIAKQQGAQQAAKQYLLTTLSPVLQSLDKGEQDSLRSLLKARRDLQIRQRGGAAKSAVSTVDLEAAVQAGNANTKIASAADAITQAHRDLLKMRKDAGLLTDEAYQAIVASDDFYTPLYRELAEDPSISLSLPGARTGKFGVGSTGVRRMDRTVEALENTADPLEMLAADAIRTYRDVGKQRVANIIFDLVDTSPGNVPFVKRIQADPTRPPRRDGVIQQIRNGKLYTYEVTDPDLFKALAGQDQISSNAIMRVAQTMKNLKTSGIVVLPDFAIANVIRDVAMSGLQRPDVARAAREAAFGAALGGASGALSAEDGESAVRRFLAGAGLGAGAALYARPFVETMSAVKAIVGNEQAYREFLANGASTEGFYIKNANDAAKAVQELAKGPGFSLDDILIPTNWWETLRKIGSVGEQATRLAAYRQVLEAGGQVDDAVRAAQDRTLRFANVGASRTVKSLASMTPFWNAKVQGWDKLARMMREPKTYALGAAMLTGPSIALWSINKDNPEYWERPTYEKNLFWLVPKSAVHGDDRKGFYRIPKPFELGFMFASLPERALDYVTQKGLNVPRVGQITSAAPPMADPARALKRSAIDIGAATFEGTLPLPEIVALPGQLIANRDLFRNRPIVTRPNLPTELQVTKESSAIARALSKVGISPEKTDFAIRSMFGTAGAEASKAVDIAARAAGMSAPEAPESAAKLPLLGRFEERFSTSNRGQSEPEALARDQIRELSTIEAGFRELKRLGNPADIIDYVKRNRAALLLADRIQPLERELDKLASYRTKIAKNPKLTNKQKLQALEILRVRGATLSRQMLTIPSPEEQPQ